jgi:hypothetical protein
MNKKWIKRQDNFIVDAQTGEIIALIATDSKLKSKIVEVAPEMLDAIFSFVEQIDAGKFPARSIYNDLREILKQIPEDEYHQNL